MALVVAGSWLLGATGSASVSAQGQPAVYVQSLRFGRLSHVTTVEAETVISPALHWADAAVDWYVGLIAPDGRFLSFVGDPDAPTLAAGATPVPLATEITVQSARYFFSRHRGHMSAVHGRLGSGGVIALSTKGVSQRDHMFPSEGELSSELPRKARYVRS